MFRVFQTHKLDIDRFPQLRRSFARLVGGYSYSGYKPSTRPSDAFIIRCFYTPPNFAVASLGSLGVIHTRAISPRLVLRTTLHCGITLHHTSPGGFVNTSARRDSIG